MLRDLRFLQNDRGMWCHGLC